MTLHFHPLFENNLKQRNALIEAEYLSLIRSLYPENERRDDQERIAFIEAGILERITAIVENHLNGFPTRDALDVVAQWVLARGALIQKQLQDRGRIMSDRDMLQFRGERPSDTITNCRCVITPDVA